MSIPNSKRVERLMELLADRATTGLDQAEETELNSLLAMEPAVDSEAVDRAAATLSVGLAGEEQSQERVPQELMARLMLQASEAVVRTRDADGRAEVVQTKNSVDRLKIERESSRPLLNGRTRRDGWKVWGGWMAAAACLTVAVVGWLRSPSGSGSATSDVRMLVDRTSGTVSRAWGAWPAKENEPAAEQFPGADAVKGQVVWNQQLQKGYMVFSGLTPNNPASKQYQLWIIDKNQKNPIDGGVFDIAQSGEVVIPITAKLPVKELVGFGVTVEPPGGVVVSDQNRRVVVALVGQ